MKIFANKIKNFFVLTFLAILLWQWLVRPARARWQPPSLTFGAQEMHMGATEEQCRTTFALIAATITNYH